MWKLHRVTWRRLSNVVCCTHQPAICAEEWWSTNSQTQERPPWGWRLTALFTKPLASGRNDLGDRSPIHGFRVIQELYQAKPRMAENAGGFVNSTVQCYSQSRWSGVLPTWNHLQGPFQPLAPFTAYWDSRNCTRQNHGTVVTALFTKLLASWLPGVPWFCLVQFLKLFKAMKREWCLRIVLAFSNFHHSAGNGR